MSASRTQATDTDAAEAAKAVDAASLFADMLSRGPSPRREAAAQSLDAFLAERDPVQALALWTRIDRSRGAAASAASALRFATRAVADIDRIVSRQIDAILHHPRFQRLEASWRGLHFLAFETDAARVSDGPTVKVRVLDLSWRDLTKDVERAAEFDQTQLFRKVYEAEFGTAGGEPYGLLLGDYEILHRPGPGHPTDDVSTLEAVSHVAAASFAPFVVGGSPGLLGLDAFRELELPLGLERTFEQVEYRRWNALRRTEDSRFVNVVMPRVLARAPHSDDGMRRDGFRYEEDVRSRDSSKLLWGTGVYAVASAVVRAVVRHGWPASIRGVPEDGIGGGIVAGLPLVSFGVGPVGARPPTDVVVTTRLERELADLGFTTLCALRDSSDVALFSDPSIQEPTKYDTAAATANARLSSMLHAVLCVSRFAHYIKVMAREKIGSFATPTECESELNAWLGGYCVKSADATPDEQAARPLAEARVEVKDAPGRPGSYACVVHLQPHFQVEQIATAVRLVTEFAPIQAG
jgi:type VI secretion system protein ImpD